MFCWLSKALQESLRFYFYDKNPFENPLISISMIKINSKIPFFSMIKDPSGKFLRVKFYTSPKSIC